MMELKVYINNRIITITNLSELSVSFYPKYKLFILRYSDDYYDSRLICTHENLSTILGIKRKISKAYSKGNSFVKF